MVFCHHMTLLLPFTRYFVILWHQYYCLRGVVVLIWLHVKRLHGCLSLNDIIPYFACLINYMVSSGCEQSNHDNFTGHFPQLSHNIHSFISKIHFHTITIFFNTIIHFHFKLCLLRFQYHAENRFLEAKTWISCENHGFLAKTPVFMQKSDFPYKDTIYTGKSDFHVIFLIFLRKIWLSLQKYHIHWKIWFLCAIPDFLAKNPIFPYKDTIYTGKSDFYALSLIFMRKIRFLSGKIRFSDEKSQFSCEKCDSHAKILDF